ncbi:MAG: hypothetical protein ACYCO4_00640 [Sulfobacillus sp.]
MDRRFQTVRRAADQLHILPSWSGQQLAGMAAASVAALGLALVRLYLPALMVFALGRFIWLPRPVGGRDGDPGPGIGQQIVPHERSDWRRVRYALAQRRYWRGKRQGKK